MTTSPRMDLGARTATPEDYPHFVRFFAELRVPDPVPSPERFARDIAPRAILLVEDGLPVAYAWFFPLGPLGRVVHVVVDPGSRGRGVGRALMNEVALRLRAAGCTRWMLNVKPDNVPAIRLYGRSGLSARHRSLSLEFRWDAVARLPSDAHGFSSTPIADDGREDAAIEAAFGLGVGRLALLRSSEGRVLLRLRDPSSPSDLSAGAAVFDPAFPGASPFSVRAPALARALLQGLRPHARPQDDFLNVFVEGDPALAAVLSSAGATTRLEVLRMEGPL